MGEKNRRLAADFEPIEPALPAHSAERPISVATYVAGGVALAAFASAIVFGAMGRSDLDALHRCSPYCSDSDVDTLRTKMIVTDVTLAIGTVATGVAAWLFFTRPEVTRASAIGRRPALVVW
jgi:hypothetical protein